jgi:Protein of unknown function (DUF5132)
MEFEALFLGLEPIAALAIGVGALAIAPVVTAIDAATGNAMTESARSATKKGLVWALETIDKTQSAAAEVSETFQDLVAEAKAEIATEKSARNSKEEAPREVTIT